MRRALFYLITTVGVYLSMVTSLCQAQVTVSELVGQARYAYTYKSYGTYGSKPIVIKHYLDAMNDCGLLNKAEKPTNFTWAGRILSNGKFTITKVEPGSPFALCVDKYILSHRFTLPPTKEFDSDGGYPLTFNYPYGDFDGGPTQGLARKEEEKYFIPNE